MIGYLMVMNTITRERHFHIVSGNEVVFHIHPVDKNTEQPLRNHTHSTFDFFDYQCNTLDFQECVLRMHFSDCPVKPVNKLTEQGKPFVLPDCHCCLSLRAPPFRII